MRTAAILLATAIIATLLVFGHDSKAPELRDSNTPNIANKKDDTLPKGETKRAVERQNTIPTPASVNLSIQDLELHEMRRLLESNRFSEAVDMYEDAYTRYSEAASRRFRSLLVDRSSKLTNTDPVSAVALLSHYVRVFYRDVDALMRLAKLYELQHDYAQSVNHLQDAYLAAHIPHDLERIQSHIDRVVRLYARNVASAENPSALVSLYLSMIERQPDHAPYYLDLARAHLAANNQQAALSALRYIQYDGSVGAQAREMIARLYDDHGDTAIQDDIEAIPLSRDGNHFIVNAIVNGRSARLIVDTGASITTLKSVFAASAGIPTEHSRTVILHTANGPVRAPLSMVDRFQVGESSVTHFNVVVLDLPSIIGMDGLLGMDYLSRYRFTIDRNTNTLLLSK